MLRVGVMLVVVALGGAPALADEADPDTELAQRMFAEGAAAYDAHDYARALERFEAARRVKPLPAFDYNIARCHDRLGQAEPAIAAYERYLAQAGDAPDAAEVRSRVAVLKARVAPTSVAATQATTTADRGRLSSRRLVAPIVVGVVGVAMAATGVGLVASINSDYDALDRRWRMEGPTAGVASAADSLRAREIAGWVLLIAGPAALVTDVALWVIAARRGSPSSKAVAGYEVGWAF